MRLKILHVSNIAQNAYINASILNRRGHDCDLLAFDLYHVASSPEWYELIGTAVDVRALGEDPYFPDFYALGRDMPAVAEWVAQGPITVAMRYLSLKRRRDPRAYLARSALNYFRFKTTIQRTTMPNLVAIREQEFDALLARYDIEPNLLRRIRTGRMAERYSEWIRQRIGRDATPGHPAPALPVSSGLLHHHGKTDATLDGVVSALRNRGLAELFMIEYQSAALETRHLERLGFTREEVLPFMGSVPAWQELASHYDICLFYGDSPIYALLADLKNYYTLEHGTIRSIPFEPSTYGRLVGEAYRNAKHVFLTNTDYATAETKLEFKLGQGIYAFHPFDEAPAFAIRASHVHSRTSELISFFCPARQDWVANDPKSSKGNDIYFKAAKRLIDAGRSNFVMRCIEWGVDMGESRELVRELGLTEHIVWTPIMSKRDLWTAMIDAHAVLDQFLLSSFSGVTFESLALGCRLITKDDGIANNVFFAAPPPLLSASTVDEVARRMESVMDDPDDQVGFGEQGIAWIREHHSADRLVELQLAAFAPEH